MTLMTRAVTAFAVLSLAAIPVGALTIKNTSSSDVSIGVDNGADEAVYQIPAGGSVDVKQDCSSDCAVTGPWGYSRLLSQTDTLETDGGSLVTADATPPSQGLVPQNPVTDTEASAAQTPAAEEAPAAKPARVYRKRQAAAKPANKGPGAGSFELLFLGPGK
ncbi:MAG: hypothetical protein AB7S70_14370 [Hyphomicrobium sp.]